MLQNVAALAIIIGNTS